MGKIPNFLNPPDNTEALTDHVLWEWSYLGMHMNEVHAWACQGEEIKEGLTDRIEYLLEVLECIEIMEPLTGAPAIHPKVAEWKSIALMTINCINGGSVPIRIFTS